MNITVGKCVWESINEEGVVIDLGELDYFFAVTEVDPRIGQWKLQHVTWGLNGMEPIDLELTECRNYLTGRQHADRIS